MVGGLKPTCNLVICMDGSGSMSDSAIDVNKRNITIERLPLQALAIKALLQILYKEIGHRVHLNVSLTKQLDHRREVEVLFVDRYLRDEDILHSIFGIIDKVKADSNTDLRAAVISMIDIAKTQVAKTTDSYSICLMYTDGEDTHCDYKGLARRIEGLPISINTIGISTQCDFHLLCKIADAFDGLATFAYDHNSLVDTARHLALAITKATERGSCRLETPGTMPSEMPADTDDVVTQLVRALDAWLKEATSEKAEFNEMNLGGSTGVNGKLLAEFKGTPDHAELLKALAVKSEYQSWGLKWIMGLRMQYNKWVCANKNDMLPQQFKEPRDDQFLIRALEYCDDERYFKPLVPTEIPDWRPCVFHDDYPDAAAYKRRVDMLTERAKEDTLTRQRGGGLFGGGGSVGGGGVFACSVRSSARAVCFDMNTPILCVPDPVKRPGHWVYTQAKDLKCGDTVLSAHPIPARVEKIFISRASTLKRTKLRCPDGSYTLEITSNHPIVNDATGEWIWPKDSPYAVEEKPPVSEESEPMDVCSIMLSTVNTHPSCNWVMTAGGFRVITLGHNIRDDKVAEHVFFGNRRALDFYVRYLEARHPDDVNSKTGVVTVTEENLTKFREFAQGVDIAAY